jgi:hypothetical protein
MLACDLIMDVRASRTISADQVDQLERMVFSGGAPGTDQLDLLYRVDAYVQRAHPRWAELLERAAREAAADGRTGRVSANGRAARAA